MNIPPSFTVKYFAWLREIIGANEEQIYLPPQANTIDDLIDHLITKDEKYLRAFEKRSLIQVAVDQEKTDANHSLIGIKEIAFFPPMTGG